MAAADESGPGPAVSIQISPLRRADLAITNPISGLFALSEHMRDHGIHNDAAPVGLLQAKWCAHYFSLDIDEAAVT